MNSHKYPLFIPSQFYQQFLKSGGIIKGEDGLYAKWLSNHWLGSKFHKLFHTTVNPAKAYPRLGMEPSTLYIDYDYNLTPEQMEMVNTDDGRMAKTVGIFNSNESDNNPKSKVTVIRNVSGPVNQYTNGQVMQIVNGPDTVYFASPWKVQGNNVLRGVANNLYTIEDGQVKRYPNDSERQAFDAVDSLFKAKNAMFE